MANTRFTLINRFLSIGLASSLLLLAGCSGGKSSSPQAQASAVSSATSTATTPNPPSSNSDNTAPPVAYSSADIALSWDIPAAREDNSPLPINEIAGYEISYQGSLYGMRTINIPDVYATQYTIIDLPPDNYEIAVFAYDIENAVSKPSAIAKINQADFPLL